MKTTLRTDWTVGDICKGFVFDQNNYKKVLTIPKISCTINIES